MPEGLSKTKRRINSVTNTKKITKAMELIASVKLKKFKNTMHSNCYYADNIDNVFAELFAYKKPTDEFEQKPLNKRKLYIVINSNLGLCSSYNNDVYKYVVNNLDNSNDILAIGQKGSVHYSKLGYKVNNDFVSITEKLEYEDVLKLSRFVIEKYNHNEYGEIHLIYTHYVNSITFTVLDKKILPVDVKKGEEEKLPPILEPDVDTLIEALTPIYVSSTLYSKIIEAQVSEQASRRRAMESANDNADELLDKLRIEYNKARQSAITQEITEIISGSQDK